MEANIDGPKIISDAISDGGIRAVCRTVIRNYLGPWLVARVRSRGLREDLLSSSRLAGETESRPGQGVEQGSMVRSARILRVTRVAARLDCLQRLSNVAARVHTVQEKQICATNWCKISRFALCRSAPRVGTFSRRTGIKFDRVSISFLHLLGIDKCKQISSEDYCNLILNKISWSMM